MRYGEKEIEKLLEAEASRNKTIKLLKAEIAKYKEMEAKSREGKKIRQAEIQQGVWLGLTWGLNLLED